MNVSKRFNKMLDGSYLFVKQTKNIPDFLLAFNFDALLLVFWVPKKRSWKFKVFAMEQKLREKWRQLSKNPTPTDNFAQNIPAKQMPAYSIPTILSGL